MNFVPKNKPDVFDVEVAFFVIVIRLIKRHGIAVTPLELTDSLIVFLGMEIYMCPFRNFKKVSIDEYRYEYAVDSGNWYHVSLRRSSKNRDLWLEVITLPDDEHFIGYNAYTPLKCIGSFDLIDYRTDDHIPEGLCGYEETSPEDF